MKIKIGQHKPVFQPVQVCIELESADELSNFIRCFECADESGPTAQVRVLAREMVTTIRTKA